MDWKEKIKRHLDSYRKRNQLIGNKLTQLVNELARSPYGYKVNVTANTNQGAPFWEVAIEKIQFTITFNELLDRVEDEAGYPIERELPEQLEERLKDIIVRKIEEKLSLAP